MKVWRRLQQLGALVVKQAVYALPDSPDAREDFEWLKSEIEGVGGQAAVFTAEHVDGRADDSLVEQFRQARQVEYAALADEVAKALDDVRAGPSGRMRGKRTTRSSLQIFRQRLAAIERTDFFGSAGRDRVVALLDRMAAPPKAAIQATGTGTKPGYHGRVWVTRPRPGVDRMSSAWLIRRFVDQDARFHFASGEGEQPATWIPFDTFGAEFSHRGSDCTFETLCKVFAISGRAVERIAALVHDLDLKDGRFGAPDAATVGAVIEGLQLAHGDDHVLLERGMQLFESLYLAFDQPARRPGPRAVAKAPRERARRRQKSP